MQSNGHLDAHPHLLTGFVVLVLFLIGLDLLLMRKKKAVAPTFREALLLSGFWIGVAAMFNAWIAWYLGLPAAFTFLTGYVVELSLSVDNLFVFILIFGSFKIPEKYQHRVLFWGILGALVMRAICIYAGVAALQKYTWLEFVFAAILVWAGFKTLLHKKDDDTNDPTSGWLATTIRKFIPISDKYEGERFFIKEGVRWVATPLFLVLILVEVSDLVFAVDSIPAVLAITKDPFLVYSSNIFAILGLRSLYFLLSRMVTAFRFLNTGVSVVLIFIGIKMASAHWYQMPIEWALGFILTSLTMAIGASIVFPENKT